MDGESGPWTWSAKSGASTYFKVSCSLLWYVVLYVRVPEGAYPSLRAISHVVLLGFCFPGEF